MSCKSLPSADTSQDIGQKLLRIRVARTNEDCQDNPILRRRVWKVAIATLNSLGFMLLVVTCTPLVPWWNQILTGPNGDGYGRVLIVLGAAPPERGILSQSSYLRSAFAAKLYAQQQFREVIISGGDHTAVSMASFLESQGVPAHVLRLETRAASTRENALYVKPFIDSSNSPVVLLTSDFHMLRTSKVFQKLGINVVPYPIPDAERRASRWWSRWSAFIDVSKETGKLAYYFLRGWI